LLAGGVKRSLSPATSSEKSLLVLPSSGQNGTRPGFVHQLATLQNGVKRFAVDMDGTEACVDQSEQQDDDDRPVRWPGLEGIMEAYQKYAQGKFYFSIAQCNKHFWKKVEVAGNLFIVSLKYM